MHIGAWCEIYMKKYVYLVILKYKILVHTLMNFQKGKTCIHKFANI